MILTCLPQSWSVRKIMQDFNAPNYMVRQSKKILKEKGILESCNRKPGKSLSSEVVEVVRSFYKSDEISWVLPGMKDCVSVRTENGDKVKLPKRLILCNVTGRNEAPERRVNNQLRPVSTLRRESRLLNRKWGRKAIAVCYAMQ